MNGMAAVAGGVLVVNTIARAVYGVSLQGETLWKTDLDGPSTSEVRVVGEQVALITDSLYLIRPSDGNVMEHRQWPEWQPRHIATAGQTIALELSKNKVDQKSDELSEWKPRTWRRVILRGAREVAFDEPDSVDALRYEPMTRLFYECSFDGVTAISPRTGKMLWQLKPPKGSFAMWTNLPAAADGMLYLLGEKTVYALRHP